MKTSDLEYPVITLGRSLWRGASPDDRLVSHYFDQEDLTVWEASDLPRGALDDLLIIDANGRLARVVGHQVLGPGGEHRNPLLRFILRRTYRTVRLDLADEGVHALDDIKARVVAAIRSTPDDWRNDELIAGEDGPLRDEQELLAAFIGKIEAAASVRDIVAVLQEETDAIG